MFERATSPLEDGSEIVIFPAGASWGFRLPEQHVISLREDRRHVYLATPQYGSGFELQHVELTSGEVRVRLGAPTDDAHAVGSGHVPHLRAYPFSTHSGRA